MRSMKGSNFRLLALAVLAIVAGAWTDEAAAKPKRIAVVVHPSNPIKSLKADELRRVFLREDTKWPNKWLITVLERDSADPIREQFSVRVLGRKPGELRDHWLKLKVTRGLEPPKMCRSALLLKRYLARVEGAVGYLYEDEVDASVKVICVLEVKASEK